MAALVLGSRWTRSTVISLLLSLMMVPAARSRCSRWVALGDAALGLGLAARAVVPPTTPSAATPSRALAVTVLSIGLSFFDGSFGGRRGCRAAPARDSGLPP